VKTVILFKHGVGYFERSGQADANQAIQLQFQTSDMDDVLKSLTVDVAGGMVAGLRYDPQQSSREIPFQIDPQSSVAALLDQLKGAEVELKFANRTAAGAIISARVVPGTNQIDQREQVTLLAAGGELQTVDLSGASIRLTDAVLQGQLNHYLAVLAQARARQRRSVYIDVSGTGRANLTARYMVPMPAWKSSYRLIFPNTGEPVIEGWAIVDNTTEEDWTKVQLALVSGKPISFLSKLYEPKFVNRASGELAEDKPQEPVVFKSALAGRLDAQMDAAAPAPAREAVRPSTVQPAAYARELGELFEYRFDKPVTVARRQSVMLPFLQQRLGARKLIVYKDRTTPHPLNSFELANSTGKTLDGGPLTVYDAGSYAGEALIDTLKQGDKRIISYGVDLGSRVTTAFGSGTQTLREVHARRGILTAKLAVRHTTTYTVTNIDNRGKTLIIEQDARPGHTVLEPKPKEITTNSYRFEMGLGAGAKAELPVIEEHIFDQTTAVSNVTPDLLVSIISGKELTAEGRKQLTGILDKKRQIAATDASLANGEKELRELSQDQQRIRENLASLNRVAGQQEQVQRYAQQLAGTEARIAALRDQTNERRRAKTALESELSGLIEKMEF
jgi:hypothetical protein